MLLDQNQEWGTDHIMKTFVLKSMHVNNLHLNYCNIMLLWMVQKHVPCELVDNNCDAEDEDDCPLKGFGGPLCLMDGLEAADGMDSLCTLLMLSVEDETGGD